VENRPTPVARHRSSSATRALAALGGAILGIGALAAIAFAVVGRDDAAAPATTAAAAKGPPPKETFKIIFPEGFTVDQMGSRVKEVNKIAADKRGLETKLEPRRYVQLGESLQPPKEFPYRKKVSSLEGFLFPATYELFEDATTKELIDKQLAAFMQGWGQLDLDYAKSKNLNAYDVLIIASMVEKEVQVPKERALVAAVIYNRLKAGMPLGIDATIRYGLDIPPTEPLHVSELESDSPYNTRCPTCTGLTPTPIANPGLASLQAAAHPAKVDYLYFIRKADCKSHFFTASEQEFLNYPRDGLNC
jgi:uncharacterized YceG family protein